MREKIVISIGSTVLFFSAVTPTFAATTIQISGNGSNSGNTVHLSINRSTTIAQNNNASISNNVSSNANAGGNSANSNTGGSTGINTGNSISNISVATHANINKILGGKCWP